MYNSTFHLVRPRPWPLIQSINTFNLFIRIIIIFNKFSLLFIFRNLILFILSLYQWWRDVTRESTLQGIHSNKVYYGLKLGIIIFIISELFFFISFFWTYFRLILSPSQELGLIFPPLNIIPFNPYNIPLLNTIILLRSGVTITWTHNRLLLNKYNNRIIRLFITIILGVYFTILQRFEYIISPFTIRDSFYGRIFFIATGFHGFHVLIGTIFLITCLIRLINYNFSKYHHFGFEAASWYWHFVDVVWLFLYLLIYWWPN